MENATRWFRQRSDDVMGVLMAVMFSVFILQITTRYLAKFQLASDFGWTMDLSSTCMIWLIFFGGAFALVEADHVKFDMIYNLFGTNTRRWISVFTSIMIAGLFAWAMPAVWKYISFLYNIGKPNSALRNPLTGQLILMSTIYSIYVAFAIAMIWRYSSRAVRLIIGHPYETLDGVALDVAGNPISDTGVTETK
jgi:TRAP-type C4-dicarboxylate transport system permease small subunit